MSFEDIRKQFIIDSSKFEYDVPSLENDFFQFIGYEYFFLNRLPYSCLLDLEKTASEHIDQIRKNITYCEEKKNILEEGKENLKREKKPLNERIEYESRMLKHYIALNKTAEQEITEFRSSDRIYETAHLRAQRVSFGIGFRPSYSFECDPKLYDVTFVSNISNKFLELGFREYGKAEQLYIENREDFHRLMRDYIADYKVADEVLSLIGKNHYLNERSYILVPALEQYKQGNKSIFLHIAPSQIEGILRDYCTASEIDEIIKVKKGFCSSEYFKFEFPIIRNKIAHGELIKAQDIDFFSDFTLLDLLYVSNRITSDNFLLNRVLSCIQQAYEFNDNTSLVMLAMAFASREFSIPEFYQMEDKITELKTHFKKNEFFNHLSKLSAFNNKIINKGIKEIVIYLKDKELGVSKKRCIEILRQMKDDSTNDFTLSKFIDEIDSNAA